MPDLTGQVGELRMSVQIVRKATGEVETHELVGFVNEEQLKQLQAQAEQKEN